MQNILFSQNENHNIVFGQGDSVCDITMCIHPYPNYCGKYEIRNVNERR